MLQDVTLSPSIRYVFQARRRNAMGKYVYYLKHERATTLISLQLYMDVICIDIM